jgi:hypothetical protein
MLLHAALLLWVGVTPGVQPPSEKPGAVCPGIIFKTGPQVSLPCAPGARIIRADLVRPGCVRLTHVPERGAPRVTETICEGDPRVIDRTR